MGYLERSQLKRS